MLARQEEEYEIAEQAPQFEQQPERQSPVRRVLDTSLRSHCQILFAVAAVMAMLVTIQSGIIASRGYKLVADQQKAEALEEANRRLNVEIDQLKAPQRIKAVAADKLGMEVPNKIYFAHDN